MMKDSYWLPPRKAWVCRALGAVFLFSAAVMVVVVVFAGLTPGASPYCEVGGRCVWKAQPTLLLSEEVRLEVGATPKAQRAFDAYVARPDVRLGLAGIQAINLAPFAFLLLGVGLALRRLGGSSADTLARALKWLRLASLAAGAWALTNPIYESLVDTLLSAGTPSGPQTQIWINLANIAGGLLLACAAYATIWALEAGLAARRDLDRFV
jgi:hypothetical protein